MDIPEDIDREATRIAGEYLGSPISCSHLYTLVSQALLAQDKAATERERERCAKAAAWWGADALAAAIRQP